MNLSHVGNINSSIPNDMIIVCDICSTSTDICSTSTDICSTPTNICSTPTENFMIYYHDNICNSKLDQDPINFYMQQAGNWKYYADWVFRNEISFQDGFSKIHFNYRGIKLMFNIIN